MRKSRPNKKKDFRATTGFFLFALVISFAVSTGAGFYYFKDRFAFESDFIADIEARQVRESSQAHQTVSRRLYGSGKPEQESEDRVVLRQDALLVIAEDIIRKYIEEYKVRLLDLYLDKEGVLYIDFGDEIKRNFEGDAMEEIKIISSLYSGIKSTIPGLSALKILIEGSEAESFGGHIDISKPIGEEIAERN